MYNEDLIVGLETSDDAAVYKVSEDKAIILTLDFFTPIVDDPYTFGKIAAANSLSDVYAMGGEPTVAMNIVGFPACKDMGILKEILRGGVEKVLEAGAVLVGGHTVDDNEPKYGLSVTGVVHPDKVRANCHVKEGDVLILTKPIGTGIINTAIKGDLATEAEQAEAIAVMEYLNKYPADAIRDLPVNGVTDITGFGLVGHMVEMAEGSGLTMELYADQVPMLEGALNYARMGIIPGGAYTNMGYFDETRVSVREGLDRALVDVLYDPQTSGGLLISVPKEIEEQTIAALKEHKALCHTVVGRAIAKENVALKIQ